MAIRGSLVGVSIVFVLIGTSCSAGSSPSSSNGGSSPDSAKNSTVVTEAPSVQAASPTSAAPAKPTHGIVVATEDTGVVEVGMIDPVDGSYEVENTFEIGDFAKGPNEPSTDTALEFHKLVSPDRSRIMAQRNVNGDFHTGWITADGKFIDVTAATMGQRTDFSGPISTAGLGFDGKGNFYYKVQKDGATEVWALPPGATSGQKLVLTTDLLTRYLFDYDGTLQFNPEDSCANITAYSWLGDSYLHSDGRQIYLTPRNSESLGNCDAGERPLLPTTNTASVADPVASPDGSQVAFIYENGGSGPAIYIVDIDGKAAPRKLDRVEWPGPSTHLVDWK